MKVKDYFRKPIFTHCTIQGVETDVMVDAEYIPPGGPVCAACNQPCSVREIEIPIDNYISIPQMTRIIGVSWCCNARYINNAAGEQVEALDVRNARGVSIMDGMYMVELEALEDHLLAMAKADLAARKEDAAAFAREMQHEALREGREQRGARG